MMKNGVFLFMMKGMLLPQPCCALHFFSSQFHLKLSISLSQFDSSSSRRVGEDVHNNVEFLKIRALIVVAGMNNAGFCLS